MRSPPKPYQTRRRPERERGVGWVRAIEDLPALFEYLQLAFREGAVQRGGILRGLGVGSLQEPAGLTAELEGAQVAGHRSAGGQKRDRDSDGDRTRPHLNSGHATPGEAWASRTGRRIISSTERNAKVFARAPPSRSTRSPSASVCCPQARTCWISARRLA